MAKRNYGAERRAAGEYADKVMAGCQLPRREWLARWDMAYRGFLAGLRASLQHSEGNPK